ncbi:MULTISPECIES: hypothetical protein [unclassified Streptomyces]|uniref:hypothetical protein n=1 Tax=unclassified Streptomyces TaxID=2593676 RepID=UPI0036E3F705
MNLPNRGHKPTAEPPLTSAPLPPPPASPPPPDAHTQAVLRVAEDLTTQVRRIADALMTPADGRLKTLGPVPRPAELIEDERAVREHEAAALHQGGLISDSELNAVFATTDERQAVRWARREPLLVLLTRLQRGRPVTAAEADTLRQHVETEIGEAHTAREEAEYYQQMSAEQGQALSRAERFRAEAQRDRDQHAAVLAEVLALFTPLSTRSGDGTVLTYSSDDVIEAERMDRWRSVIAPNAERPWWQTVAEVRAELEQAQAAIERVRMVGPQLEYDATAPGLAEAAREVLRDASRRIRAALDGAEQPTEQQPEPAHGNLAAYQAAIARVVLVLREAQQHREQIHPSARQNCVRCGADHLAEIRAAIKGEQPTTEAGQ